MADEQPSTQLRVVGLLGARSLVGVELAAQLRLDPATQVRMFSRRPAASSPTAWEAFNPPQSPSDRITTFVSLMPIWALADYTGWLESYGCERLIALSSTSKFTKAGSRRSGDRVLARNLELGEAQVSAWAVAASVSLTIVRPTMIYGTDADGNVSAIASALRRYRAFPVVGRAGGLRQPVHVADVAWALARLAHARDTTLEPAYNISGSEVLTYRDLVERIRRSVPGPTVVVRVPAWMFSAASRAFPHFRLAALAAGMAERMGQDMIFDHTQAQDDFGFRPRAFDPRP